MDIEALKADLRVEEGEVFSLYLDHLDNLTFGVGHLVTKDDPEYGGKVGDPVDRTRVEEVFHQDVSQCVIDCEVLFPCFKAMPYDVKHVLASMMFNLGLSRLSLFVRMRSYIEEGEWELAAGEMYDSKWRRQLPSRSSRLIEQMRSAAIPF